MSAALLLFACPAALAFVGAYRASGPTTRETLRYAAATVLWTAFICLIITRS